MLTALTQHLLCNVGLYVSNNTLLLVLFSFSRRTDLAFKVAKILAAKFAGKGIYTWRRQWIFV